jgi:hypothetical protein
MAKVRIKQYRVYKGGRGFWCPNLKMRKAGFVSTPCGVDGPEAWAIAEEMNRRWQAVKRGDVLAPALAHNDRKLTPEEADNLIPYKRGSLGYAFKQFRATSVWTKDKAPRTREDWWRGWRHIGPVFGQKDPRTVTLAMMAAFRDAIEAKHGVREAHRTIKIWRALWQVNAANHFCDPNRDPSKGFANRAAEGRSVYWLEAEALALSDHAWKMGFKGLSALIRVLWDTAQSPVDVRTLRASQMATSTDGAFFFTERAKTDKPIGGILRPDTVLRLTDYIEALGVAMAPDAFVFRNRSGAPYSKDTLGDDFRDVRADLYGPDEKRTMADFRRSGATEAVAGNASPAALAHALGNSLDRCHALFRTYCPISLPSLKAVAEAREIGSKRLAEGQKGHKMRNASGRVCATPDQAS